MYLLPESFTFTGNPTVYYSSGPFYGALAGCVSGMVIGLITEVYTSYSYTPVKELMDNCKAVGGNAATNIV